MSFSLRLAELVAGQFERYKTLNTYQLAGHVANIDFWLDEVRHALDVVAGYERRYKALKAAQDQYVTLHSILVPCRFDIDIMYRPDSPNRIPGSELSAARRILSDAVYGFLTRLAREELITSKQARAYCDGLGIGMDPRDFRPRR